jgi:hypothetical protein
MMIRPTCGKTDTSAGRDESLFLDALSELHADCRSAAHKQAERFCRTDQLAAPFLLRHPDSSVIDVLD